jgi:LCP family protein required for cell wall assembly
VSETSVARVQQHENRTSARVEAADPEAGKPRRRMRSSWTEIGARLVARPVVRRVAIGVGAVLYVVLLGWLNLHGHIDAAVWMLVLGVLALVGLAVWQWRRHHRTIAAGLLALALVVVGGTVAYGLSLNSKIAAIPRINTDVLKTNDDQRPTRAPNKAVNILLMGADNPQRLVKKPTVAQLLEDGTWDPGAYRSDTMMVVHIPANRKTAYVVSVPRDSYVPIYDDKGEEHDRNKINEAFSAYGPFGTLRTIEELSGVRIDHLAIIDYAGFNQLTTAIGGIDVYVPETVYDEKQKQEWTKGWHHIAGELALKYVRQRHGLTNGDFDRIDRQQNFLRAVLQKTLSDGTIGNPVKLNKVLGAITGHLAVDGDWSTKDLRNLALSLRGLNSKNVRFMTLPLLRYQVIPGVGDSNIIDEQAAQGLWKAVLDDKVGPYLKAHPDDELPDPKDVS